MSQITEGKIRRSMAEAESEVPDELDLRHMMVVGERVRTVIDVVSGATMEATVSGIAWRLDRYGRVQLAVELEGVYKNVVVTVRPDQVIRYAEGER